MGSAKKILIKFLLLIFLLPLKTTAQDLLAHEKNWGFNIGLNAALGTHFQRIGINLNFYYVYEMVQANSEIRAYYSFRNLGPRFIYPELVLSQGIGFGYGVKDTLYNPFIQSISNQTYLENGIFYAYNWYLNKKQTTQRTGIAAFHFNNVTFIAENDLLARPALDRFRTGAFLLQYQYENVFQAAINCTMWTGRMGSKSGIIHPSFHYQCYMDTTNSLYPNYSNGLLSAQFKYLLPYGQTAQANAGIDAEQVRNAVQNHFIHDMRFIPKKYNKARNCHIPMLDRNNQQFLYREGQQVRKPKVYLNLFTNASVFY